jgi:hypothetical protein
MRTPRRRQSLPVPGRRGPHSTNTTPRWAGSDSRTRGSRSPGRRPIPVCGLWLLFLVVGNSPLAAGSSPRRWAATVLWSTSAIAAILRSDAPGLISMARRSAAADGPRWRWWSWVRLSSTFLQQQSNPAEGLDVAVEVLYQFDRDLRGYAPVQLDQLEANGRIEDAFV